jgi:hypothetical protein
MYLTDFRENTLHDVITKIEPERRGDSYPATFAIFGRLSARADSGAT